MKTAAESLLSNCPLQKHPDQHFRISTKLHLQKLFVKIDVKMVVKFVKIQSCSGVSVTSIFLYFFIVIEVLSVNLVVFDRMRLKQNSERRPTKVVYRARNLSKAPSPFIYTTELLALQMG